MANKDDIREGEVQLSFDPAQAADGTLCFIGRLRSRWQQDDCPRNIQSARSQGGGDARIELSADYVQGLTGLNVGDPIWVLYWMDRKRRDLILQSPGHKPKPCGVFSIRSPARPNPIAMAAVRITSIDVASGVIGIDAIDAFDGTPVVDVKPWLPSVDIVPEGQAG